MTAAVMKQTGGAQALPTATGGERPVFDEGVAREFLETLAGLYEEPTKYVFEVCAIHVLGEGHYPQAAHFHGGEIDEALAFARKHNTKQGWNVYVGAGGRAPERLDDLRQSRAKEGHVRDMGVIWADFDDEGAAEAAAKRLKDVGFMPHMAVTTGTSASPADANLVVTRLRTVSPADGRGYD